jgi:intein/homing endonuclease
MHELGFPYGNKSSIVEVPDWIIKSENKELIAKFLRGLFDTDGCIHFWKRTTGKYCEFKRKHHYYPVIKFSTISEKLGIQIKELMRKLISGFISQNKFKPKKINENIKHVITIYGPEKTNKFFEIIGSKNIMKLSRFILWKKIGHCPSHLTLNQRLEMLKNPL